jgi:hypothetical protein
VIAGAREIKAVNTLYLELRETRSQKFTKARSDAANQLANNLEVQTGNVLNHIFDQTVGNPRAITE